MLVVGAGHVSMPLCSLARIVGFKTIVVDGRPRFATRERFPDVDELKVGIPSELVRAVPLVPSTALVLVAHDYKYDLPVLRHALGTPVGYIGLLGSSRRGKAILDLLREDGLSEDALARVRVPIGLDLGAQTAPEIALAVLAEVLAVQRGATLPADQRKGPPGVESVKAIRVLRDGAAAAALEGRVICHDVRDGQGKVAVEKGQVLDAGAAARLLTLSWREVHLLELEPGDIHEEPAGARLSQAAAGEGVEVRGYGGGQWTLAATRRGLLRVRGGALAEVNAEEGMAVYTLYDLQPVESGEAVARAKIVPLAIGEAHVKRAEERAWAATGLVTVKPFTPRRIGALTRASLPVQQRARFETALGEKMDWLGSRLLPVHYCADEARAVADGLEALAAAGAELVIAAGAASLDPLDAIFEGLKLLPAAGWCAMERRPIRAASCGWRGGATAPSSACRPAACSPRRRPSIWSCRGSSPARRWSNADLAAIGHGGLLSRESAWRFPPYRQSAARGELPE